MSAFTPYQRNAWTERAPILYWKKIFQWSKIKIQEEWWGNFDSNLNVADIYLFFMCIVCWTRWIFRIRPIAVSITASKKRILFNCSNYTLLRYFAFKLCVGSHQLYEPFMCSCLFAYLLVFFFCIFAFRFYSKTR